MKNCPYCRNLNGDDRTVCEICRRPFPQQVVAPAPSPRPKPAILPSSPTPVARVPEPSPAPDFLRQISTPIREQSRPADPEPVQQAASLRGYGLEGVVIRELGIRNEEPDFSFRFWRFSVKLVAFFNVLLLLLGLLAMMAVTLVRIVLPAIIVPLVIIGFLWFVFSGNRSRRYSRGWFNLGDIFGVFSLLRRPWGPPELVPVHRFEIVDNNKVRRMAVFKGNLQTHSVEIAPDHQVQLTGKWHGDIFVIDGGINTTFGNNARILIRNPPYKMATILLLCLDALILVALALAANSNLGGY